MSSRKILFRLFLMGTLWLGTEGIAFLGLSLLEKRFVPYTPIRTHTVSDHHKSILEKLLANSGSYLAHDPVLGWSIRPNIQSDTGHSNAQGLRGTRDYTTKPAAGVTRISAFGDSYTHGDDVKQADTWAAALENLFPNLEVLNFGVPGYGTDQAYLRYRHQGITFQSTIVLICYMSENINRMVNVFRPFYAPDTGIPLAKPRFLLDGDRLSLLPNPLPSAKEYRLLAENPEMMLAQLGRHDFFFKTHYAESPYDFLPSCRLSKIAWQKARNRFGASSIFTSSKQYNTDSEAFQVTARILEDFFHDVLRDHATPLIVILPSDIDLLWVRQGKEKSYIPLLRHLDKREISYLDLFDTLQKIQNENPPEGLFTTDRHYTPHVNQRIAQRMFNYLQEHNLLPNPQNGNDPDNPPS
jgi:hypothetical protein